MDILKFTEQERGTVFDIVASILHLGNITFEEKGGEGGESKFTSKGAQSAELCCNLLKIKAKNLELCLCSREIRVGMGTQEVLYKVSTNWL